MSLALNKETQKFLKNFVSSLSTHREIQNFQEKNIFVLSTHRETHKNFENFCFSLITTQGNPRKYEFFDSSPYGRLCDDKARIRVPRESVQTMAILVLVGESCDVWLYFV